MPEQQERGPDEEAATAADGVSARLTLGQHLLAFLREIVVVVIGAVIVASLLRGFVGQMFVIPSISMEDTLQISDRVLVEKLSSVKRGQVVVFEDPGGWLTENLTEERGPIGQALEFIGVLPDTGTDHLIKRAVGLPGDRVVCCDRRGRLSVNDQPLDEARYLYGAGNGQASVASEIEFDVVVPAGRIFVLGDNREHSRDSRCHLNDAQAGTVKGENAFVPQDLIVGRAIAVVWPVGDAAALRTPPAYATVPAGRQPAPSQPTVIAGPEADC